MTRAPSMVPMIRPRYYLGLFARDITAAVPYARTVFASAYPAVEGHKAVFASLDKPTPESHPGYGAIVGPFRTKRAALYMATHPMCVTVGEAEIAARRLESAS